MSVIQANMNVESKKIILHLQYGGAKLHSVYSLPIFSRDRNHLDERLLAKHYVFILVFHSIVDVFENILHKAIYNTSLIHDLRPIHLAQRFLTKLA